MLIKNQRTWRDNACIFAFAMLMALTSTAFINIANAEPFLVHIDQARLLPLKKQSASVIVGNPSIADVSVQSGNLLVVTGKSFGTTNVIVLDSNRKIVINTVISVTNDKKQVVQLFKGSLRRSYNCADKCTSVMTIGDEGEYTKNLNTATTNKAALAGNGGQGGSSGQ